MLPLSVGNALIMSPGDSEIRLSRSKAFLVFLEALVLGTWDILREFCLGVPLSCPMPGRALRARLMGGRAGLC